MISKPTLKEKKSHFDLKSLSHCMAELKFDPDPGFRVIGEYLHKIGSILRVNLTQILSNYSESQVEFSSASDSAF